MARSKPQFGKMQYKKSENIKVYPSIKKTRFKLKWKPTIDFNRGTKIVINSFR